MRDPQGSLSIETGRVVRRLEQPLSKDDFLHQSEASELVEKNLLIDFEFITEKEVVSPLIPFVSYPHEWSNAQLYDAANITLEVAEVVEKTNWELKDASAWNVIFNGTVPVFCDHLSFQKIKRKNWWAFAQFVRHFLLPLCVAKYAGLDAYESFKLNRDGLKPQQVKAMLGLRRFATRFWSLLIEVKTKQKQAQKEDGSTPHHKNLFSLVRYYLNGALPKDKISIWSDYVDTRSHYEKKAQEIKNKTIEEWLKRTHPNWVTDFGCNTGEYTRMANRNGAKVIAIDLDHECIQQLYRDEKGNRRVYPVVADLDDLFTGRGWAGSEFAGLVSRIARVNEMALMLALIHHIAISNSIPYLKIAEFARSVTKKWIIVEMLDHEDPLVVHLSKQRDRSPDEFTLEKQMESFSEFFEKIDEYKIEGTHRQLVLMKVKEQIKHIDFVC